MFLAVDCVQKCVKHLPCPVLKGKRRVSVHLGQASPESPGLWDRAGVLPHLGCGQPLAEKWPDRMGVIPQKAIRRGEGVGLVLPTCWKPLQLTEQQNVTGRRGGQTSVEIRMGALLCLSLGVCPRASVHGIAALRSTRVTRLQTLSPLMQGAFHTPLQLSECPLLPVIPWASRSQMQAHHVRVVGPRT